MKIKELQGLKHTTVEVGVYLQEHVVEDEKQIYDLSSRNKDVKTTGRLVEPNALQLADELERSCKISINGCVSILLCMGFIHLMLTAFGAQSSSPTAALSNKSVTTQKRLTFAL